MMNALTQRNFTATHLTIASDFMAVRHGLQNLFALEPLCALSEDCRDRAEIVMAEALNNIVEHAYGSDSGEIQISVGLEGALLSCLIKDRGKAMPDLQLPKGEMHSLEGCDELPEGGFGWFMIRSLTKDLHYSRAMNENCLQFRLAI